MAPSAQSEAASPTKAASDVSGAASDAFSHRHFGFTAGVPAPAAALVRDDRGSTLLTYPGFSSPIAIVGAVAAAIVGIAGTAAAAFLLLEGHPFNAILAVVLSVFFALVIAVLVPPTNVTISENGGAALTIAQRSRTSFPTAAFEVIGTDGRTVGVLRKSVFSRLARNGWRIGDPHGQTIAYAVEESLTRAWLRKLLGKFSRRFECDFHVYAGGALIAQIVRRSGNGPVDVLDVYSEAIDRRLLVALAILILGSEP